MERKIVFSGVQPSGKLTIGNYLGAIKNWVDLQNEYNCYYCIVDLHAITIPQVPKDLRKNTLDVLALYLAAGIDPEKSTIFIQSHVPEHTELTWVLNSISYMGQLNRMTQFKEKSRKSEENLNAALFTYPVLMASDILLYEADLVPVGEDQKQHLELARDLAIRFNNKYSDTFKVPDPQIKEIGAKIMSLQNPEAKMSKSDTDENAYILLLDDKDTIRRKIKRAVTDSLGVVAYNDEQIGLKNLLDIYSVFSKEEIPNIVNRYEGKGYGEFKEDLAEVVVESLSPIQEKYNYLINNKDHLEKIYKEGAEKASYHAMKTLRKVYKKVGFIPK
ncbi:tryptophan--tRNA ligase [Tissierella pigra]|uniref:Tryptophan--tRNA ligase n=1 Tax=Tissierella pigra TaxID=2607614 RepID=A0A6N7XZ17_9FIRM|nr:tryptophan--tRNA ligase [Tissierella pigra]MBU5427365.1 tryptophan--tRNA ligase [Tissierella pigra]MSU03077.1 tryptophan--tRNA ligase [Tissierella pigra]